MTQNNDIKLQIGIDYELLNGVRLAKNLTFEQMESGTGVSKDTIKNILYGKVKNPGVEKLSPICEFLGVSIQKVLRQSERTELENQGIKTDNVAILALKEIYEMQQAATKETNELHIKNIREHYEQHRQDYMANVEKRLADKLELINSKNEHIKTLNKVCLFLSLSLGVCLAILITLLIAEVMNPHLGWIQF